VTRGYVPLLVFVAGIWGASYMFIEIAVDEIEPIPLMAARLLLAALILVPFLMLRVGASEAVAELRAGGRGILFLGFANSALPFTLIAWGQQHVDSSIAAIANAPVPIFVALLAIKLRPSERASGLRLVGIFLGFLGVGVLVGFHPGGGWWAVAGTLAVVSAAFCYAIANLYAQGRFAETSALVIAAGASLTGGLMLLPLGLVQLPDAVPSAMALGSVAALGIFGTALALLLYYRILTSYGAARASLVTYLIPPVAVVYGVTILDEDMSLAAILGLALILGGVALGSGVLRFARRGRAAVVPAVPRS
jgi:drug/metabolite transporter (DMT)-like permease